ncbi:nucleoside hydrolase, partial [Enterobacter hormaechei]|uniref:nucleoside hydrolase n=1 Tax=Enterobacter hormaechei TaxID=158836 RepID=UPI002042078C
ADARPAAQLIIDQVRAHPGEVTLVAVGRMTNLALALQQAPDIAGLVRGVVIMGGAFHVNGNITPAAEFNIAFDPEAAHVVFTSFKHLLVSDWEATVA